MFTAWFAFLASLFISVPDTPLKPFRIKGFGQGSTYNILYYGTDSVVKKQQVEDILARIDQSMSLYKAGSLINQFNASETGVLMDPGFKKVVQKALQVYKESQGYFDITVKPLVDAWGFGVKRREGIPDSSEVISILPYIGSDKLQLVNDSLLKKHAGVQIDLNGIAQGYTVDEIADFLEQQGINNYMVELGGEIRINGKHPDGKAFRIGIESPDTGNPEGFLQQTLALGKSAITTSGNYRRFVESGGKKYGHLIDPHTGFPYQHSLISVTLIATTALDSDAYDNVLMGLGLEPAMDFMKQKPRMEAYFIYRKPDGSIGDTATSGFYKYITHK